MSSKSWIRNLFSSYTPKSSKKTKPSRQLSLLSLEERIVPSTFTVSSLADTGAGSLRQAITDANASNTDPDVINFGVTGTITLQSALPNIVSAATSGTLTINGPGASTLNISGDNGNASRDFRIFRINNLGNLTLTGVTVSGAKSTGHGGAIFNEGNLTVNNSTLSNNILNGSNLFGGAIFNASTATTLNILNSTLSGNSAPGTTNRGGAIANESNSTLNIISNSIFSGNSASLGGGAVFNSSIGALTIFNSTFSANSSTGSSASNGGAIQNAGVLNLSNSTLSGNTAVFGGAISNGPTASVLNLSNSTLSGNTATGDPSSSGGGINNNYGTVTIKNSTIAGNSAIGASSQGGGFRSRVTTGTVSIGNTIIANNTSSTANQNDFSSSNAVILIGSPTVSNLVSNGSFPWATTKTSGEINLGLLQDNGGPTFTRALGAGSVAIGAGNPTISNAAPINGMDQRGYTRSSTTPSIGAFEFNGTAPAPTVTNISPASGSSAGGTAISITGTNLTGATAVTIGGVAATNVTVVNSTTITATTPAGNAGNASVLVTTPDGTNAANTLFTYVGTPPAITSASSTSFTYNTAGTFTVTASGDPTPTFSISAGVLPAGVTLSSAGALSGSATATGIFNFTITASNGIEPTATQPFTLTVNQAASTTTLLAAPNPSVFGQTVTFTATVAAAAPGAGTPSGTVNFFDGATHLGSGTLSAGSASISTGLLATGSHSITTVYGGDADFIGSTSSVATQTVNQASTTSTLLAAPNPSVSGQTVTFTATVSAVAPGAGIVTGTVNFFDGATLLGTGTLTGGVATLSTSSLAVGNGHNITANYGGDINFTSSPSPIVTQTVNLAPTITSANSADFTLAVAGSFTVTTTASFPVAVSFTITSGTLPAGLILNSSTGVLSGTPATGTFGTYNLAITASNGVAPDAVQPFTLKVLLAPAPLVTGSAPPDGNDPDNPGNSVNLYDPVTGQPNGVAVPFPNFMGEVRVAAGDFNQDGRSEIVAAAGPNGGPAIAILDSVTGEVRAAFFAYGQAFTGGVFVAVKDVNNDGFADIITGAGAGGGPHVKVFNGTNLQEIASFFAYAEAFSGGVSVASADINGDNVLDIVTGAGPGGGPHVKVFDGASQSLISEWYAYPVAFSGGVFVGMGDLGNDGNFEVITGAGSGGGPVVAVFDPFTGELQTQFLAYSPQFLGGVRVGASDGTGDGMTDLITGAGPGGGPHVKAFSYPDLDLLFEYFSGPISDSTGVFVS